jgi:hypothetical protein
VVVKYRDLREKLAQRLASGGQKRTSFESPVLRKKSLLAVLFV